MNRPVEWTERLEDRSKRRVRVSFFSGRITWQIQEPGTWNWSRDITPSLADWERLHDEVRRRYQRRRATHKEFLLSEAGLAEARRQLPPA
jgi:hypothetical protein